MKEGCQYKNSLPHERNFLERDQRTIRIFLVRHGRQQDYGTTNSPLSMEGRTQIKTYAETLVEQFKDENRRRIIKVLYSSRLRARESAEIIENEIDHAINEEVLPDTVLYKSRRREVLQTADSLNKLITSGVPKNEAIGKWLNLEEQELLNKYGSKPPSQVAKDILHLRDKYKRMSLRLGTGPEIDFIMVTHETTIAALSKHLRGIVPMQIDYAARFELII